MAARRKGNILDILSTNDGTHGDTATQTVQPGRRGRPRSARVRVACCAAAAHLTLAGGPGAATVDAIAKRDQQGVAVPVLRVEQVYPYPDEYLAEEVGRFGGATELVWFQEEPENMGAWQFVRPRLESRFGDRLRISRACRPESGSPATGSHAVHVQEQEEIVSEALGL